MKRILIAAVVPLALTLAACGEQEPSMPTKSSQSTTVTAGDVKQKVSEAAGTAADYAEQQRRQFVADAQRQLDGIDAKIVEWKAKAKDAKADAKTAMDESLRELEKQRKEAADKLAELKSSGADAWENVKQGFQNALDKLRDSYEKAKQQFA